MIDKELQKSFPEPPNEPVIVGTVFSVHVLKRKIVDTHRVSDFSSGSLPTNLQGADKLHATWSVTQSHTITEITVACKTVFYLYFVLARILI